MGEKHQVALGKFTSAVTNPAVLTYPDFNTDFILDIDTSKYGLGFALYQQPQDQLRVILYDSRTLIGTGKCCHSFKLEYIALKWAVSGHFELYLYYTNHCDFFTDKNRVPYAISTAKLNETGQHWTVELYDYPIAIHDKQDIQNKVADCLSRSPIDVTEQHQILSTDKIKAILSPVKKQDDHKVVWLATRN